MSSNERIARRPPRKPWPQFVLWWLVPFLAVPAWVFVLSKPPGSISWPLGLLLAACIGLGLFVAFDLSTFKLAYSILGPLQRTPVPQEAPLFGWDRRKRIYGNLVRVGVQATCIVYPSGLGFRSLASRSAFIPLEYVDGLDEAPFGRRVILHHSPEVRRHIVVFDDTLAAFLEKHLAEAATPKA